jgi:acetyl-CoA synthetase
LKHPEIKEAAAIGAPDELKGERLVCFAVLKDGGGIFENELKKHCERLLGKTLVPDKIYFVSALPKTRSGKIPRGLIKHVFLGKEIKDTTSVDNPQVLEEISRLLRPV